MFQGPSDIEGDGMVNVMNGGLVQAWMRSPLLTSAWEPRAAFWLHKVLGMLQPTGKPCAGVVAAVQNAENVDVLHAPAVLGEAALFQEDVPEAARRACTFRAQVAPAAAGSLFTLALLPALLLPSAVLRWQLRAPASAWTGSMDSS